MEFRRVLFRSARSFPGAFPTGTSRGRGSIKQARRPRRRAPSSTARCLRALQEAESALTQYAHDRDQNARLRTARDRSREAAGLQTRLARGGVVSGLEVLDVERTLASAEAALAASNTKLAGDRVHIVLALGGRSEERRVGKECVRTGSNRWW